MDLDHPILREEIRLHGKQCFCEVGERLAWDYLQAARDALKRSEMTRPISPPMERVPPAFALFWSHSSNCKKCSDQNQR